MIKVLMFVWVFFLSGFINSSVFADEATPLFDRTEYFSSEQELSDDLRQLPRPLDTNAPDGQILITNARLFVGTGEVVEDVDILIDGKRISAIAADLKAPPNTKIINASGKTVMPGLIDLHTHITYMESFFDTAKLTIENPADSALRGVDRLRVYAEVGITSIRDVASHGMAPFTLKKWVAEGRIIGPRIFASGQMITGTGGHATEGFVWGTSPKDPHSMIREASGADDWAEAVREQFKRGADWIKISSHYSPAEAKAAIDEAHRLGLRVTTDSETIFTEIAIDAGVDCVEHPLPGTKETIRKMSRKSVSSVPTFFPYQKVLQDQGGYFGSTSRRFTLTEEVIFEQGRKMKEAGIIFGVGTDLILDWYKLLPQPYIQELKNFSRLGYSPTDALIAATHTSAKILGKDKYLGTVEVDKLADIIVVSGIPDQNLDDLRNVETVIIGGRLIIENDKVVYPARHRPVSTDSVKSWPDDAAE